MSAFDQLLDELAAEYGGRARVQKPTLNGDLRKALAIGEDGVDSEIHPSDRAIADLFRRVVGLLVVQAHRIRHLEMGQRNLLAELEATRGKPMTKAIVAESQAAAADFMAKAMEAQSAGRISGSQVAIAEAYINAGKAPPVEILRAVAAPAAA